MSVGVGCGVVDGDNVGSGESAQTGHYGYGHYGYGYGHYGSYGYGSYGYGYGGYGGGYGYP
jgi:hypothetical protein